MPIALSSLTGSERGMWDALLENPDDGLALGALNDLREERGQNALVEISRGVEFLRRRVPRVLPDGVLLAQPDHLWLLRGRVPTDEELATVLPEWRSVVDNAEEATDEWIADFQWQYLELLGMDALAAPDIRKPEGLKTQYDVQRLLWHSGGVFSHNDRGEEGIVDELGAWHAFPSLERIRQVLLRPEMQRKIKQGFTELMIVPFGLPFDRLTEVLAHGLRSNGMSGAHGLTHQLNPVRYFGTFDTDNLRYVVRGAEVASVPKQDVLHLGGWQTFLMEPTADIPAPGEGQVRNGRRQIEMGPSPWEAAAAMARRPHEEGWTPEVYAARYYDVLMRGADIFDMEHHTFCIGARLIDGNIPVASNLYGEGVHFDGRDHEEDGDIGGARAAVRIL